MVIEVYTVEARLARADEHEKEWLRDYLTFTTKGFAGRDGGVVRMLNVLTDRFPAGFVPLVRAAAAKDGRQVDVLDMRPPGIAPTPDANVDWLRDYQREALRVALDRERGILWLPTGAGKCLGRGTPVLRFDGQIVPVESVREGDELMGPDSTPRRVLSTTQGRGPLYRIVPNRGTPWVCNDVHVLTLKHTETAEVVDIPLNEYLGQNKNFKHLHKQFGVGVLFAQQAQPLPVDPYFLGVWYGDGKKALDGVTISKPDPEIRELVYATADAWGLRVSEDIYPGKCPTYRLVRTGKTNPLLDALRALYGDGSTMPHAYLTASWADRKALLAGLLDTDGYLSSGGYEIAQRRKGAADGICYLARSLGLRAHMREKVVNGTTYYRTSISGDCSTLPMRIPRKRAGPRKSNKNPTHTGFDVEAIGEGEYFGFTLDGDGRFLLGDFTVTHNTELACGLARSVPGTWLFLVHRLSLLGQTMARFESRLGESAGTVDGDSGTWRRFTVATFQTLARRIKTDATLRAKVASVDGIIVDEAHTLPADSFYGVTLACTNARYRIGLSGTPLARGDRRSVYTIGALGPVIHRIRPEVLIERGVLSRPKIHLMDVLHDPPEAVTWQGVYTECVVRSRRRNLAVLEAVKQSPRPCLVFVSAVEHGHELVRLLGKAKITAEFTWGDDSEEQRQASIRRLVRGDIEVLVCSVIFQEGVDIPALRSVVIAAGGASGIAAIQRVGRGMRMAEGKDEFVVWDVSDRGQRWLERHTRARRRAYEAEGYEIVSQQMDLREISK